MEGLEGLISLWGHLGVFSGANLLLVSRRVSSDPTGPMNKGVLSINLGMSKSFFTTEVWRFLVPSGCCDDVFASWWLGPLSPGINNDRYG